MVNQSSIKQFDSSHEKFELTQHSDFSRISFTAMASNCEVLVRNKDNGFCLYLAKIIIRETRRIELKYSRYLKKNIVDRMNHSQGNKVKIDKETFNLLEYARNLFELSDGLFDITSGVLRKIWKFVPNARPPTKKQISKQLDKIGFSKLIYNQKTFQMAKGMEIDFGGIGKEYAVDQVTHLLADYCTESKSSFLVNFGGDLSACKLDNDAPPWTVGIETPDSSQTFQAETWPDSFINISHGSVATSGTSKRYFDYQGKRYSHLLNPKTGYPVEDSAVSITAFADNCVMAGSLSSLAMLKGRQAEAFLIEQSVKHLCIW